MYEHLLFAQIPPSRHNQLLRILSGVAGQQPTRAVERHLMFMPRKVHDSRGQQVGGTQTVQNQQAQALQSQLQGDLFHLQLVGDVDDRQFPDEMVSAREKAEDELMKDAEEGSAGTRGRQGRDGSLGDSLDTPFYDFEKQTWSL